MYFKFYQSLKKRILTTDSVQMKDSVQKLSWLLLFSPDRKVYFYYDKSQYHFFC